ncbi:sulfite exporter TauE/SafE family protein [Acidithiobacillus sulfuriphilus]|uniref:sulfite exporter TauE/SafE family protein n=1 Tax=Acidithiobacillus sulfuriphilus TaxID=1867749 RepID=UPI003F623384
MPSVSTEWWLLPALFAAGMGAGFINVLAGAGSMLTLPVLIFVGLDPITANGTNRISIFLENLTAARTFYHHNLVDLKKGMKLALWTLPGAMLGAIAGVHIGNLWFQRMLVIVLALSTATMFFPKIVAGKSTRPDGSASPWLYPTMLTLGFYGGFMQLGIGFLFIFALRHLLTRNLAQVNAYKTLIITLYTLPTILVFAWMGQVHWGIGFVIGIGGMIGARLATGLTVSRRGELWVKVMMAIIVLVMAAKLWV